MPLIPAVRVAERIRELEATNPLWWAVAHRRMPDGAAYSIVDEPFRQPYLMATYRAMGTLLPGGRIVVMKCAQSGWTEAALNFAFWFLDKRKEGVLYMLPTDRQLSDFAQARVNKAIKLSPYLKRAFTDTDNVGLKIGFGQSLYLRGANSKQKLLEIPVGALVRDEFGAMDPEGREQAESRLGASRYKYKVDLSNPQFPESGIHLAYLEGTQEVWEIECPKCGAVAEPRWPDSVDPKEPESIVCPECGYPVDKYSGKWRALNPEALYRSFRMSQLISPTVRPWELMETWKEAKGDATKLQVFYNFHLGLPYAPEGARIDEQVFRALPRGGEMALNSDRPTVMGVDVGAVLHVWIRRVEGGTVWVGTCDWNELERKMGAYNVQVCGIDAMPETTKAKEFAARFPGRVVLIRYHTSPTAIGGKQTQEDGVTIVTVPRTEAMDRAFARILNGEESVPEDLPEEVIRHFRVLTRQIVKGGGKEYASWVESGPDHYAHAYAYSEVVRDERPIWQRVQLFV